MDAATKLIMEDIAKKAACNAVDGILIKFGIDSSDPIGVQKDMAFLRDGRNAVETAQSKALFTVIGLLVAGLLGAFLLGVQSFFSGN